MDELRELLSAWRDAKRSAWRAVVTWAVRLVLAMLLIGIAVRLRLTDLVVGEPPRSDGLLSPRGEGYGLRVMRRCSTGRTGAATWSARARSRGR